jgi:hypothetical protein
MAVRVFDRFHPTMNTTQQVDLCRAYLQSSAVPEGRSKGARKPDGPVVTISRAAGARGSAIAKVLVKRLADEPAIPHLRPWTLFDQNLLQQVIKEHHLPEKIAEYFPEDKPDEIRHMIGELLGLHPSAISTLRKIAETIRSIAKAGNAVIVGRGAGFITADIERAVHVRLVGSDAVRIHHFARRAGISEQQAAVEVAKIDRGRKRYIKSNFKRDIEDPRCYDLVINTDRFSDDQAASLILHALRGLTV